MPTPPHLPLDVLNIIAGIRRPNIIHITDNIYSYSDIVINYRNLLSISRFARSTLNTSMQNRWQIYFTVPYRTKYRLSFCKDDVDIPLDITWVLNGKVHRLNSPAVINKLYNMELWYCLGLFHRVNGPAVSYTFNGRKVEEHWINGKRVDPR
jgi:hypothetical protein